VRGVHWTHAADVGDCADARGATAATYRVAATTLRATAIIAIGFNLTRREKKRERDIGPPGERRR
jgi:hypothetical protein